MPSKTRSKGDGRDTTVVSSRSGPTSAASERSSTASSGKSDARGDYSEAHTTNSESSHRENHTQLTDNDLPDDQSEARASNVDDDASTMDGGGSDFDPADYDVEQSTDEDVSEGEGVGKDKAKSAGVEVIAVGHFDDHATDEGEHAVEPGSADEMGSAAGGEVEVVEQWVPVLAGDGTPEGPSERPFLPRLQPPVTFSEVEMHAFVKYHSDELSECWDLTKSGARFKRRCKLCKADVGRLPANHYCLEHRNEVLNLMLKEVQPIDNGITWEGKQIALQETKALCPLYSCGQLIDTARSTWLVHKNATQHAELEERFGSKREDLLIKIEQEKETIEANQNKKLRKVIEAFDLDSPCWTGHQVKLKRTSVNDAYLNQEVAGRIPNPFHAPKERSVTVAPARIARQGDKIIKAVFETFAELPQRDTATLLMSELQHGDQMLAALLLGATFPEASSLKRLLKKWRKHTVRYREYDQATKNIETEGSTEKTGRKQKGKQTAKQTGVRANRRDFSKKAREIANELIVKLPAFGVPFELLAKFVLPTELYQDSVKVPGMEPLPPGGVGVFSNRVNFVTLMQHAIMIRTGEATSVEIMNHEVRLREECILRNTREALETVTLQWHHLRRGRGPLNNGTLGVPFDWALEQVGLKFPAIDGAKLRVIIKDGHADGVDEATADDIVSQWYQLLAYPSLGRLTPVSEAISAWTAQDNTAAREAAREQAGLQDRTWHWTEDVDLAVGLISLGYSEVPKKLSDDLAKKLVPYVPTRARRSITGRSVAQSNNIAKAFTLLGGETSASKVQEVKDAIPAGRPRPRKRKARTSSSNKARKKVARRMSDESVVGSDSLQDVDEDSQVAPNTPDETSAGPSRPTVMANRGREANAAASKVLSNENQGQRHSDDAGPSRRVSRKRNDTPASESEAEETEHESGDSLVEPVPQRTATRGVRVNYAEAYGSPFDGSDSDDSD